MDKDVIISLTNSMGILTRALCRIYEGKSIKKEVDIMNSSIKNDDRHNCSPHPPCPSNCPCMEQKYVLSEGYKVNIEEGKEVEHDFVLDLSPFRDCGTLSGRVKDEHCKPIKNALVKVFNLNHEPIAHVFTNKDGEFLICLPAGKYLVKAVH